MIVELVNAGLSSARQQVKTLVRRKSSTTVEYNQTTGILKITRKLGIGTSVVHR